MRNTINKYPKVFNSYKEWLIQQFKLKYKNDFETNHLSDNLLKTSIIEHPISMVYFFDEFNIIGTLCYNELEKTFEISINGKKIKENTFNIGSKIRKEAEILLIQHLFVELEKTL